MKSLFNKYLFMKPLKSFMITGILFVMITGSIAHFLYNWSEDMFIVGLFTPVNESIWEHMKLLFFPMLLYSFLLILGFKQQYPSIYSALCAGTLAGTLLIPLFFYSYTAVLRKDSFALDIGIFLLSTLIAFWISYRLTLSSKLLRYTPLLCCSIGIIFILFLLFTYNPPNMRIFADPAI